jgi:hypothetical protein
MAPDPMSSPIKSFCRDREREKSIRIGSSLYLECLLFPDLPEMILFISFKFWSEYRRQFLQSRPTLEMRPSLSHRNNVAFEISNRRQMSFVLYCIVRF